MSVDPRKYRNPRLVPIISPREWATNDDRRGPTRQQIRRALQVQTRQGVVERFGIGGRHMHNAQTFFEANMPRPSRRLIAKRTATRLFRAQRQPEKLTLAAAAAAGDTL